MLGVTPPGHSPAEEAPAVPQQQQQRFSRLPSVNGGSNGSLSRLVPPASSQRPSALALPSPTGSAYSAGALSARSDGPQSSRLSGVRWVALAGGGFPSLRRGFPSLRLLQSPIWHCLG